MITTSYKWKDYVYNSSKFMAKGIITAKDGSVLELGSLDFMTGTCVVKDAVSGSSSFDIGSVITNAFKCTLNNFEDKFSGFSFTGSVIEPYFGIRYSDGTEEWIKKGKFTIERPKDIGYTIPLTSLDYMDKFNISYSNAITFPCTVLTGIQTLCNKCGVELASTDFVGYNVIIPATDFTDAATCREILQKIVELIGSYARINNDGKLEIKWYNLNSFSVIYSGGEFVWNDIDGGDFSIASGGIYTTGDDLDGNGFLDKNGGDTNPPLTFNDPPSEQILNGGDFFYGDEDTLSGGDFTDIQDLNIVRTSSKSLDVNDVVITGIKVIAKTDVVNIETSYIYGDNGYILVIKDNPFITTQLQAQTVATYVGQRIIGMRFRPFDANMLGDPSIEAGDSAYIFDTYGNMYQTYVTNLSFNIGGYEFVSCGAESPIENTMVLANANTQIIQDAVNAAYENLTVKGLSAEHITAGTITGEVVATNFKMEGGSINVNTANQNSSVISMSHNEWNDKLTPLGLTLANSTFGNTGGELWIQAGALGIEVDSENKLWLGNSGEIYARYRICTIGTDDTIKACMDSTGNISCLSFNNNSLEEMKKDIVLFDEACSIISDSQIYEYRLKTDEKIEISKRYGFVIGPTRKTPCEVLGKDGKGIDLYNMSSINWKATQELIEENKELKQRIESLEEALSLLLKKEREE